MGTLAEFEKLYGWINKYSQDKLNTIGAEAPSKNLDTIESLIGEKLPEDFKELYSKYDGEIDSELGGIFLGEKFLSSSEIITYFEFPKSLIKPDKRYIKNPEKSTEIINEIKGVLIDYLNEFDLKKISWYKIIERFFFKIFGINYVKNENWSKIEISFGERSFSGPVFFMENEKTNVSIEPNQFLTDRFFELGSKIFKEEKETYNWDDIDLVFYKTGNIDINRKDYDWDNEIQFKSIPQNTIKRKYFNIKWIPIFFDYSGNYIGIDLDPDTEGKKGQIIIFGRDEDIAYALANSLEDFFRKLNLVTESFKEKESTFPPLAKKYHLHAILPELLNIQ